MKTRFLTIVLSGVCIFLAWKLAARPVQQAQPSQNTLTITNTPLVASDADIQLLRQDLRTQKQKLIAQNLPMTESEAVKFWAVYNRYTNELRQINDEKFRLIKQYSELWGNMSNDDALIYIRRWLEVDAQTHDLRSKYVMDVNQALPGKKAATFFQLDRRITMMMDLQLSSQLPLAISQDR
jgi:hypothetical protein